MLGWSLLAGGSVVLVASLAALAWNPFRDSLRAKEYERARKEFHLRRERLEALFVDLAGNSGKPRGLRWSNCDFENDVAYARDRRTGELCAFVGVTISFEAIEGGLMEGVEAVGNLRLATAVFRYAGAAWHTDGRAIFNLNPTEAIAYYHENLEMVGQEVAHRV